MDSVSLQGLSGVSFEYCILSPPYVPHRPIRYQIPITLEMQNEFKLHEH